MIHFQVSSLIDFLFLYFKNQNSKLKLNNGHFNGAAALILTVITFNKKKCENDKKNKQKNVFTNLISL